MVRFISDTVIEGIIGIIKVKDVTKVEKLSLPRHVVL